MILSTEIYLMLDPSFLVMLVECHRTFSICNSLKNEFLSIPQDSQDFIAGHESFIIINIVLEIVVGKPNTLQ